MGALSARRVWPMPAARRRWVMLVALVLLATAGVGSTLAFRSDHTRAPTRVRARAVVAPRAVVPKPTALPALRPRAVQPEAGVAAGGPADSGDTSSAESEPAEQTSPERLPQPISDAQVRAELKASGLAAGSRATLTADGLAVAPLDAPSVIQKVIQAGDKIARLPYRYGGGHATWVDTAYDCSGSVSFALAAAGLVGAPMDSTALSHWGDAGPGRWITVYANAGHAWMTVAGLRFDTSGHGPNGSRWTNEGRSTAGFVMRHPPGL